MPSRDERTATKLFTERYGRAVTDGTRELERLVIGADWGANGYTTLAQARMLGELLELGPGRRLLDIGSGRGWPGVYLAKETGCEVAVTDLPLQGLHQSMRRAATEGIDGRVWAAVSSARHLPFRDQAFDGIVHTDVLC